MAPSNTTALFLLCLLGFHAFPKTSSRILLHELSEDSRTLFNELGSAASTRSEKNDVDSSFRVAPSGPDPHHPASSRSYPINGAGSISLREAPGGPDPHHHSSVPISPKNDLESSLREAPGGPDPHHHPVGSSLREAPGGPDPHHHSVGSSLRKAPGGPDPGHHDPVGSSLREAPGGPDPHHHPIHF